MHLAVLDFINENRKPIIELEDRLLIKFTKYIYRENFDFKEQNRNVWVNCGICNDVPHHSLIIDDEFTHVYLCHSCKKKFENLAGKYSRENSSSNKK